MIRDFISIGIDPGLNGAVVALDSAGEVIAQSITPTEKRAKGRGYDIGGMHDVLFRIREARRRPGEEPNLRLLAVLERTAVRGRAGPRMSPRSIHSMGMGYGLWLGMLGAMRIPFETVTPSSWMRVMLSGVAGGGKERAIFVAANTIPTLDLRPGRRKKAHDGLADAGCLALFAQRRIRGEG